MCDDDLFVFDCNPQESPAEAPSYNKRLKEDSDDETLKFNNNNNKRQKVQRYHLEDERFSHFRAGSISSNLKMALGTGPKQLPGYIYNMRLYGYPTGWLEEHKIKRTSLCWTTKLHDVYDVDKVISYPGFNTAPERGTLDESIHYRTPFFNPEQDKAFMIQRMVILNEASTNTKEVPARPASPSLTELEKTKRSLLQQLNSFNVTNHDIFSNIKDNITKTSLTTPVINFSEYETIPDAASFSKETVDINNFENLPNALGKYESMRGVLKKIRSAINSTDK